MNEWMNEYSKIIKRGGNGGGEKKGQENNEKEEPEDWKENTTFPKYIWPCCEW